MGNNKNHKNGKNQFCIYSGKRTANREVVLAKYALDYCKSQGLIVFGNPFMDYSQFEESIENEE